ncbi:2'-5' RNA ligase family protein [Mucilaginibacter sp. BT774]|uniref:2'-5' RNA ligase family protein n=1 Tax=Mucilaginibacter sp. BT774 TaxID=3062276 RepID=UPI0026757D39|nr:2'-5' RNA ligase family protein [Mucilaginibacter sp. BT774]MDO3625199.1 2'-5' RNA ligase family protein [Mucilaginibacter sp. BT774]
MKGYTDYLIILSPSEDVCEQIEKYKQQSADIIGHYDSMYSTAHISIKPMPRRKPYMAEPELAALKANIKLLPPATLVIDGFDFFNHGEEYRTVYAKIQSSAFTTQWVKALKKSLNIKDYLVPHIPIARNIHRNDFDKLWPHLRKIKWVQDFEVSKLTILQREALNTFVHWQVLMEIPFEARHLVSETLPKATSTKPLTGNYRANQQIKLF